MIRDEPVPDDQPSGTATSGVSDAVAALSDPDTAPGERRRAIGHLVVGMREWGLLRPRAAIGRLTDTVVEMAPRIPLRDLATLHAHHPGLDAGQISERVIRTAGRATAAIGALGGGVAAIEWAAPPALLSAPVLLAAETAAVVAVELKMLGELQELYGQPITGSSAGRSVALLQAWAGKRGVNLLVPSGGVAAVLGTAARRELRDRLLRRFGRNLTTLGPILTGAAVAAYLNRRATHQLADHVRQDLASRRSPA